MAHEIRAFTTPQFDLGIVGKVLGIEEWQEPVILQDKNQTPTIRDTLEGKRYLTARYHLDDRAEISNLLRKFGEGLGYYLPWLRLQTRRVAREYRKRTFAQDRNYHRPTLDNGLITDPVIRITDRLQLSLDEVSYRVGAQTHTADRQTVNLDGHLTTQRVDRIIGTQNGIKTVTGAISQSPQPAAEPQDAITLATVRLYPSEIQSVDVRTQAQQYETTNWQTETEFGTIPEHIPE